MKQLAVGVKRILFSARTVQTLHFLPKIGEKGENFPAQE